MMDNLFSDLPAELPEELFETLFKNDLLHIERIVSRGHTSPAGFWYDQEWGEWVIVLQGGATLQFEDDETPVQMGPGDWVNVPAGRRHRVAWTDPAQTTVWLAVHYGDKGIAGGQRVVGLRPRRGLQVALRRALHSIFCGKSKGNLERR